MRSGESASPGERSARLVLTPSRLANGWVSIVETWIDLAVCLSVNPSISESISPSICPSICPSISESISESINEYKRVRWGNTASVRLPSGGPYLTQNESQNY
eukprot:Selendium_serpulae@DN4138_c0_g1_i3.p2